MNEHERRKALGDWGERKAVDLLTNAKASFQNVRDVNAETHHHPFGDIYAERGDQRFLIGVKTRCKHQNQKGGPLNETYNIKKKGADVRVIGDRYKAQLAWVVIQVVPELQTFNAYFGTIAQIEEVKERFSIRMKPAYAGMYERLGSEDEFDPSLRPEWSNGGYVRFAGRA
jgi:hypothetical protein